MARKLSENEQMSRTMTVNERGLSSGRGQSGSSPLMPFIYRIRSKAKKAPKPNA